MEVGNGVEIIVIDDSDTSSEDYELIVIDDTSSDSGDYVATENIWYMDFGTTDDGVDEQGKDILEGVVDSPLKKKNPSTDAVCVPGESVADNMSSFEG